MSSVPCLEHVSGSWVVVDRQTGQAVLETFSRQVAQAINQTRFEVVTALQWLQRVRRLAADAKPPNP